MWMDPEDARSDFILAAAAAVFAPFLRDLATNIPGYPATGTSGIVVATLWVFAGTGLAALLLARHRGQGLEAFGLTHEGRPGLASGALIALPVVALGIIDAWSSGLPLSRAALGAFAVVSDPVDLALVLLYIGAVFVGLLLLFGFLAVRARHAFARREIAQVEALRTFGMGGVALVTVLGLLRAIGPSLTVAAALFSAASLAAVVLLTDRYVTAGAMTTRATVLGPAIAVGLTVLLRMGGIFSGLLDGLYFGGLAATIAVVTAVLVETRRHTWAIVPLFAALALYPNIIPIAIGGSPAV